MCRVRIKILIFQITLLIVKNKKTAMSMDDESRDETKAATGLAVASLLFQVKNELLKDAI